MIIGCDGQAVENSVFRTHSTCEDTSNIQNGITKDGQVDSLTA